MRILWCREPRFPARVCNGGQRSVWPDGSLKLVYAKLGQGDPKEAVSIGHVPKRLLVDPGRTVLPSFANLPSLRA